MKKPLFPMTGKNTLLAIALIVTIVAAVPIPTTTAWVDGKQRSEWTKEARNYWCNYIPWWYTNYRGVPFLTYMLWDDAGERADEYAYNASRAVTVDDVRMALYDQYVGMGYMNESEFWGNLSIFEANAATYGAPSNWPVNGTLHLNTYVHVNQTVFFDAANLTGTRFNVSIWVQNVTDMWGVDIKLGYNASMINATHVYPGAIPQTQGVEKWLPIGSDFVYHPDAPPTINHTRRYTPNFSPLDSTTYGYVWTSFFLQKPNYFTGTGELLIIEFEIIDAPPRDLVATPQNESLYTYLDLFSMFDTTVDGSAVELLDSGANPIEHAALDGRYVYIREQQVAEPTAVCSVSPSTVYVGDSVTFDGTASDDGGAPPLTYEWDVDSDGTVDATGATVVWSNPTAGTFNVTLTVTNAFNLTDSATCYWEVLIPGSPIAKFTWTRTYPTVNETVTFDASASDPNGGYIVNYTWNFGDLNITTVTDPIITHRYDNPGNYTVTLTIIDSEGLEGTVSHVVEVVKRPYVSLNPQNYTAPTVGHNFTIDINITQVTDLLGFEFKLWYNTTILDATEVVEGHFLETGGPTTATLVINEPEGYVSGTITLTEAVNGSGTLVKINFTATALGNSTLHLNATILRDHLNATIPHDIVPAGLVQGRIRVIPEFPATMIMLLLLIATIAAILLKKRLFRQGSAKIQHYRVEANSNH